MTATDLASLPPRSQRPRRQPRRRSRFAWWTTPQKVSDVFDSRANAIGFLRLAFATLVIVSHAAPLGYGELSPLRQLSNGQTDLGELSVIGFFVLSGLLITRSATGRTLFAFLWARFLRIYPGYWVCLLIMAFAVGPLLWLSQNASVDGYWSATDGPWHYLINNWSTYIGQYGIAGLTENTPYGHMQGDVLNGSLWTLRYELACYVGVAVLSLGGLLIRRKSLVLLGLGVMSGMVVQDQLATGRFASGRSSLPDVHLPPLGELQGHTLFLFGLAFALGVTAAVFPDSFPLDWRFAVSGALIFAASMAYGWFNVVGVPAFAYVTLYLAAVLPGWFRRVGVKRDISYGVYIYAFPIQQILSIAGLPARGRVAYIGASMALAALAGLASWYTVERPAMSLKSRRPRLPRPRGRP